MLSVHVTGFFGPFISARYITGQTIEQIFFSKLSSQNTAFCKLRELTDSHNLREAISDETWYMLLLQPDQGDIKNVIKRGALTVLGFTPHC